MTQQQQKTQRPSPEQEKSFDLVKVAAGAVGAMASAVLLSTLGAAGTVAGAALGSVIVTLASSMFSKGVDVSKQGVSVAQSMAMRRVASARSQVGRAADDMDSSTRAQQRLAAANAELDAAELELRASGDAPPERVSEPEQQSSFWRDRLAVLPWKRVALAAAGLFLVAMAVITGFELVSGRAVSEVTGGSNDSPRTTFSGLTGGEHKTTPTPTPSPTAPTSGTPTESATESPTEESTESPSGEPTETATSTPTPSSEPEPTDSAVPEEPTPSP